MMGDCIGSAGDTGPTIECLKSKNGILKDEEARVFAEQLGNRVAELTKIVRTSISALKNELANEYFVRWEEPMRAFFSSA